MTRRFTFLAALALVATIATGAQAQDSFAGFTSPSNFGGSIQYSNNGAAASVLTINRSGVLVVDPAFLVNPASLSQVSVAQFSFTGTSMAAPSGSPGSQNGFTGQFDVTSGTTTLLSGTFSNGSLLIDTNSAFFESSNVTYTSGVFLPGLFNETFNFAIGGLNPNLPGASANGFQNFSGNSVSGNFLGAIPEPATLAMAGFGILALPLAARVARRRRSVTSN